MEFLSFVELNNREIVTLFLVLVFISYILYKVWFQPFLSVLKTAFSGSLKFIWLSYLAWIFLAIYIANILWFWSPFLFKEASIWLFFVGVALLFDVFNSKDPQLFRNMIVDTLKISVFIQFFVSIYVFPLFWEFVLMSILLFASVLYGFALGNKKHELVAQFMNKILMFWWVVIISNAIIGLFYEPASLFNYDTMISFLLPLYFTIFFVPFFYAWALFIQYESIFTSINRLSKSSVAVKKYAKYKILKSFWLNLNKLISFNNSRSYIKISEKSDIDDQIKVFKENHTIL